MRAMYPLALSLYMGWLVAIAYSCFSWAFTCVLMPPSLSSAVASDTESWNDKYNFVVISGSLCPMCPCTCEQQLDFGSSYCVVSFKPLLLDTCGTPNLFIWLFLQVDEQFYRFLSNFFDLHSEFKAGANKSRPIFFTGESHAGHYIPSMVAYILAQNEAAVAAGKVNAGTTGRGKNGDYRG